MAVICCPQSAIMHKGTRTVQADSDSESRRRSEWGNHSGKPSDSDYLQRLYAPPLINKGHSLCRLSESASATESASTVRVPLDWNKSISQFVTHSTYPLTSPCTANPGILLWCTSVSRETEWSEKAVKEHNKIQGQNLSTLICIPSVLIRPNILSSSEGVCVAQTR